MQEKLYVHIFNVFLNADEMISDLEKSVQMKQQQQE